MLFEVSKTIMLPMGLDEFEGWMSVGSSVTLCNMGNKCPKLKLATWLHSLWAQGESKVGPHMSQHGRNPAAYKELEVRPTTQVITTLSNVHSIFV